MSFRRVHIVPIGYDTDRVSQPLIDDQADKIYFIKHITDTQRNHEVFYDYIREEIDKKLPSVEIIDDIKIDIWNLYHCVEKFREIIQNEKKQNNEVFVNVSSGSKITAIAGMLSCMIWKARPYYTKISYPEVKKIKKVPKQKVEKVDFLPVYGIECPSKISLQILNILKEKKGTRLKSALIKDLINEKIINIKLEEDDPIESKHHSRLNPLLRPLIEHEFIEIKTQRPKSTIILTSQGEKALAIFGLKED